ncbi:hypothetical protein GCM10009133_21560 [Cocleimonas flava]
MLTACSVSPQRTTSVKPSSLPTTTELAGKYSLFAGSEVSFDVSEQNGNLLVSMFGVKSKLQKITPIRYRFATVNEGRPRWFIREDSLQRNRASVTNQAVYTQRLAKNLKPGDNSYETFA